jgi:hypothetical protein
MRARPPRCGLLFACLLAFALLVFFPACRRSRSVVSRGDAAAVVVVEPGPLPPAGVPVVDVATLRGAAVGAGPVPLVLAETRPALAVRGAFAGAGGNVRDQVAFALEIPGAEAPGPGQVSPPPEDRAVFRRAVFRLAIEVLPQEGLATTLALEDEGGVVLSRSSGGPGQRHGLPNVAARGRYLLRLSRAGGNAAGADVPGTGAGAAYLLVVRLLRFEGGDEREPNDEAARATLLAPADRAPEAAGYFGGPKDQDWFRVPLGELPEGMVIAIDVEPPSGLGASLTVVDAAERPLARVRGRRGELAGLRNLAPRALATRAAPPSSQNFAGGDTAPPFFFVVVRPEGGFDLDRRYVLRVRAEPAVDGEREPNDDPVSATPFSGSSTTGRLGPGDVDVFRLDPPPAGPYTVEVIPPAGVDVVLELLRPDGLRLARADAARRGKPERVPSPPGATGPTLVRISPKRGEGRVDQPYTLNILLGPPAPSTDAGPAAETVP